jgi:hypothetical protein
MIGPCQEGTALLTRLRRKAKQDAWGLHLQGASRRWFLGILEPDIHLLSQPNVPPQEIELVISCQSRNISEWASGPSRFAQPRSGETWQAVR